MARAEGRTAAENANVQMAQKRAQMAGCAAKPERIVLRIVVDARYAPRKDGASLRLFAL